MPDRDAEPRHAFPRRMRLTRAAEFAAVREGGRRTATGPLHVVAMPNGLAHPRLGLAISRRAGGAVARNAIKRRLREAFRLMQHEFPRAYDLVISARPHEPLPPARYQALLARALSIIDEKWAKQDAQSGRGNDAGS
jgi:ribonuclease P protein component